MGVSTGEKGRELEEREKKKTKRMSLKRQRNRDMNTS